METELECRTQSQEAEILFLREQNELEVQKAKELSGIEVCGDEGLEEEGGGGGVGRSGEGEGEEWVDEGGGVGGGRGRGGREGREGRKKFERNAFRSEETKEQTHVQWEIFVRHKFS